MRKWAVPPWILVAILVSGAMFLQVPLARGSTPINGSWLPEIVLSSGVGGGGAFTGMGTAPIILPANVTLLTAWMTYEATQVQVPFVNWSLGPQPFTCTNGDPTMQSTDGLGTVKAMQLRFCYLIAPHIGTGTVWYNLTTQATGCAICGNAMIVTALAKTDPSAPLGLPASQNDGGLKSRTQYLNVSLASGTATISLDALACDGWIGSCKPMTLTGPYSHILAGWSPGPWYGNPNAPGFAESVATFYTTATSQASMTTDPVGGTPVWVTGRVTVYGAPIISTTPWQNPTGNPTVPGFFDWLPPLVFLAGLFVMTSTVIYSGVKWFRDHS